MTSTESTAVRFSRLISDNLDKFRIIMSIITFGLFVGVIWAAISMYNVLPDDYQIAIDNASYYARTVKELVLMSFIAKWLIYIAAATAIIYPLVYTLQHFKEHLKMILIVAGILALIGICYLVAPGEVMMTVNASGEEEILASAQTVKFVNMLTYVLIAGLAAGLGTLAYSEIRGAMKR